MSIARDAKRLGALPRDLPFLKDLIDFRLTRHPQLYLFVEDLRSWVNWDKRIYLSFVRRGDIVLDVGANVGAHTVFLSHLVGDEGKVVAFEPLPTNLDALSDTIRRRSRRVNIRVIPAAVGDPAESGRSVIITAPGADLTQASLRPQAAGSWQQQEKREYKVPLVSLDAEPHVQQLPAIDCLKIDVEGGELDVLKGGADTVRRHRPLIYCEVYEQWTSSFGYTPGDLLRFAQSLGYSGARVISNGEAHVLPINRDPPGGLFETSADVLLFTDEHRPLVASFDKRYVGRVVHRPE